MRNIFCILGIFIISLSGCTDQKTMCTSIGETYKDNFMVNSYVEVNIPNKDINKIKKSKKSKKSRKTQKVEKHQKKVRSYVLDKDKSNEESIDFFNREIWMH